MKHDFFNIKIDILDKSELMIICRDYLNCNVVKTIYFLNAHCYNIAQKNDQYMNAINKSDLLLNDGIGVKIGMKLIDINEKENMNGTDIIPHIIKLSSNLNKNIYLLGGQNNIAEMAAERINKEIVNVNIVGWNNGYFNKEEEKVIIDEIVLKKTDVLIVGMGVPNQELWIDRNKEKLKNVKIAIAGGAILDFLSGRIKRAPKLIRKFKCEWAYRLILEPRRLWRRYIIGNMKFIGSVLYKSLKYKRKNTHFSK